MGLIFNKKKQNNKISSGGLPEYTQDEINQLFATVLLYGLTDLNEATLKKLVYIRTGMYTLSDKNGDRVHWLDYLYLIRRNSVIINGRKKKRFDPIVITVAFA